MLEPKQVLIEAAAKIFKTLSVLDKSVLVVSIVVNWAVPERRTWDECAIVAAGYASGERVRLK